MGRVVSVGPLGCLQGFEGSRARLFALAAVLFVTAVRSIALPPDLASSFQTGDWLIKTWETAEGLPENSATAMVQTQDGYLWFGTFNGLVRFDGVKFTVFDQSNTPQLPGLQIVNLHLDRQQRLWVSTDEGIIYLHGGKWSSVFGPAQGWTGDFVRTFAEGAGKLFVTSFDGKMFEFDGQRFNELPKPPGAPGRAYFGHVDRQGAFWAVQHRFIGSWDGARWQEKFKGNQFVSDDGGAAPARDGGLWLFNRRQLTKVDAGQVVKTIRLSSMTPGGFWNLTEDSQGEVWIATYNSGVLRVPPTGKVEHITTTNGLSYVAVRFIFEDREGNHWVGTSGGGLMRFKPRYFFTFDQRHGLPDRIVRCVSVTRDGDIMAGSYGGGLVRLGGKGVTRVQFTGVLSDSAYVQSVLEDSRGRIWAGTYKQGLAVLEGKKARLIPAEQSAGTTIRALFEDSRKRIWIAGDNGVSVFDGTNFQTYAKAEQPLNAVTCITEQPDTGAIWLGDANRRLHRFQDGSFQTIVPSGDAVDAPIRTLVAETDGNIWIGTAGAGMGLLHRDRFARIAEAQGLPVTRVGSLVLDGADHIWMGTEKGIVRVSRTEMLAVATGTRTQIVCRIFDQNDYGLLTAECSTAGQPGSARDAEGRLWFATVKGLSVLDPGKLRFDSNPPPVRIESLVFTDKEGKSQKLENVSGAALRLPAGNRTVEIHYTALSFTAPSKVRFMTRLTRGGQEVISSESDRRMAVFDWLPQGDYKIHVTAGNQNGVWNKTGATLDFTVLPFYWQTNGFRVLVAGGLVAATAAVVWWLLHNRHRRTKEELEERATRKKLLMEEQARRLEAERESRVLTQRLLTAQEEERSRLARELHDDVTQRLARLALDAAQAERGVTLHSNNGSSRSMREELVRLSEDVHSFAYRLHPSILEELGLIEALRAECDRFSRAESIPVNIKVREVLREIPDAVALGLFRIAQESLRNVARHARAQAVAVSLSIMDGGLQLSVHDNGRGFDPALDRPHPSLGLASMKERVKALEGELDIESEAGHGTTIVAWVPLKEALKS